MHRFTRATILRLAVGIWFAAMAFAPAVCAAMCAAHVCPTCSALSAKTSTALPCCGHCRPVQAASKSICSRSQGNCCCKERKDPAWSAVKPASFSPASITFVASVAVLPLFQIQPLIEPGPAEIPAYTGGAPPGFFNPSAPSRAPPTCGV